MDNTWPTHRTYVNGKGVQHTILHLNNNFVEIPSAWVEEAQRLLERKAMLGLEDMTAVDRLAYLLLTETF